VLTNPACIKLVLGFSRRPLNSPLGSWWEDELYWCWEVLIVLLAVRILPHFFSAKKLAMPLDKAV
jgi:hypothetical protein